MVRYLFILLVVSLFGMASCKSEDGGGDGDKDTENSDDDDDDDDEIDNDDIIAGTGKGDVTVAGTVNLNGEDGVVIAKGVDGSILSAPLKGGEFELGLDDDTAYSVSVTVGTLAVSESGLTLNSFNLDEDLNFYQLGVDANGLNALPTQLSEEGAELDLGEITLSGDQARSANFEADAASALESIGMSESDGALVGAGDDNMRSSGLFDINENGILDFHEKIKIIVRSEYTWGAPEPDVFNSDLVKNAFLDFDEFLIDDHLTVWGLSFLMREEMVTDTATITFPEMLKVCDNENTCKENASSFEVGLGEYTDTGMGSDGKKFIAKNYSIRGDVTVDGVANLPAEGDYTVTDSNDVKYTLKNIKPRIVTSSKGLVFANVHFVVADGKTSSVKFRWETSDLTTGKFRTATLEEVRLFFEGSPMTHAIVSLHNSDFVKLVCGLPTDKVSGTVALDYEDCQTQSGEAMASPVTWSEVAGVNMAMVDAYGFLPAYGLNSVTAKK
jgi:hypothetical protein